MRTEVVLVGENEFIFLMRVKFLPPETITQQHSFKMNSFTDAAKHLEKISRCSEKEATWMEAWHGRIDAAQLEKVGSRSAGGSENFTYSSIIGF